MMDVLTPADAQSVADIIRDSSEAISVCGNGTKAGMLRPVQAARTLSLSACSGATLYSPRELVFAARAGTRVSEISAALAQAAQHIISEPPDFTRLIGSEGEATLGGLVATNLSGPRRISAGATRDHVLGVRAVNGAGELIKSGGRVLKNVTGLDLCKLLAGSHGTLAVITDVTIKVLPAPEDSASVVLRDLAPPDAVAALSQALGSPYGVSGAAYLPAAAAGRLLEGSALTVLRIEDFAASVVYRTERLRAELAAFGRAEIWAREGSVALWAAIRDADVLAAEPEWAVWRVSVRPSRGAAVLAAAEAAGGCGYLDWGGGLAMLAGPATEATHTAITGAVTRAGGVWILLRGPASLRTAVDVVPREVPALAALTRKVKAAMDPRGVFNPGRVYAGV
jgi:glycolate oxidase FAD binding subunit